MNLRYMNLIERLRNPKYASDRIEFLECRLEAADELERLTTLTENDAKEIGSYREGTGLRGENQALQDKVERLENAMRRIAPYSDVIICYASTCSEHEGNAVAKAFREALSEDN